MNITRGKRKNAGPERLDGLRRRGVLGGLAAIPVLYGLGAAATPASAAPAGGPTATGDPVRGEERRYHAPLLTAGTRLLLPAGVRAVPVQDYYHRPRLAPAT